MLVVGIEKKVCEQGGTCSADKKRQSKSKGAPTAEVDNTAVFVDSPKKADHQKRTCYKSQYPTVSMLW